MWPAPIPRPPLKRKKRAMPDEQIPPADNGDAEEDLGHTMSLIDHLVELRNALKWSFIAVGVCFLGTYYFKEDLYSFLLVPLQAAMPEQGRLIYTAPAEAFFTYLKVALLAALVGSSPMVFYQMWRFISPGLFKHERKALWTFVVFSSVLFIAGAIFCYTVVFPFAFTFFMSFATDEIVPMLSLKEYLSFSALLLLAFGVTFEMPIALVILGRVGLVNADILRKQRKFAILIMFVGAAIITPPDVISQIMMACPLLVLYEISIWLVAASQKKRAEKQAEEEAEFKTEE